MCDEALGDAGASGGHQWQPGWFCCRIAPLLRASDVTRWDAYCSTCRRQYCFAPRVNLKLSSEAIVPR